MDIFGTENFFTKGSVGAGVAFFCTSLQRLQKCKGQKKRCDVSSICKEAGQSSHKAAGTAIGTLRVCRGARQASGENYPPDTIIRQVLHFFVNNELTSPARTFGAAHDFYCVCSDRSVTERQQHDKNWHCG